MKLDGGTISYGAVHSISNRFSKTTHISFKVETSQCELAIAWLHDLIYKFDIRQGKCRFQISGAKLVQSLLELKCDGNNVLFSVWAGMLYDKSSASLAGTILPQTEFVLKLIQNLQEYSDTVVADFEELPRKYCTYHESVTFWTYSNYGVSAQKLRGPFYRLAPLKLTSGTLGELGKNPATKV
ncbi:hypothetical protein DFJ58DRAFT_886705 [Suillus subalutaceus]|uniref:uncharacterized protein n=1 Tax=Suillus subalutaceus TaxID=48586 RepID=UPI001B865F11|nr:uncharacterized protein DFJ58DRAFT_886705 [Suillus subalutaceus]KAG1851034.1 hypothetical protein DFJ58DRAFT_886705 [Suillus subalutaceus]